MSKSRFSSQIVPTDSTESTGYMFFPVSNISVSGLAANATYAAVNSAITGVACNATTAGTIISDALFVPNDLDTSQTCYASVMYASTTTATTATATFALTYQNIATGNTIVAPAVTCAAIGEVTVANTVGVMGVTNTAAMSTKPEPGTLLAYKLVCDPLVANTIAILGVKMQYTRRFV
jgi:hypothetical protein